MCVGVRVQGSQVSGANVCRNETVRERERERRPPEHGAIDRDRLILKSDVVIVF